MIAEDNNNVSHLYSQRLRFCLAGLVRNNKYTATELARLTGIPIGTIYAWIRKPQMRSTGTGSLPKLHPLEDIIRKSPEGAELEEVREWLTEKAAELGIAKPQKLKTLAFHANDEMIHQALDLWYRGYTNPEICKKFKMEFTEKTRNRVNSWTTSSKSFQYEKDNPMQVIVFNLIKLQRTHPNHADRISNCKEAIASQLNKTDLEQLGEFIAQKLAPQKDAVPPIPAEHKALVTLQKLVQKKILKSESTKD